MKQAIPVWKTNPATEYNQHIGFYTKLSHSGKLTLRIAARSYYRLFLDGRMTAHGPARTAAGYCRIDEITAEAVGTLDIAVEVIAYDKPVKYSNDCTLEPGMLAAEILDENGAVLCATGDSSWRCTELTYRRAYVETLSHSRSILEYSDLNPDSLRWIHGEVNWETPCTVNEKITYLARRAPYPSYAPLALPRLAAVSNIAAGEPVTPSVMQIAKAVNASWYASIPKENRFVEALCGEHDSPFTGSYTVHGDQSILLKPGHAPAALTFAREDSELGFVRFAIDVTERATVDVISSDHRSLFGELRANTYVSRFVLEKGHYEILPFEPRLVRYLKLVIRTEGEAVISWPELLDDSYLDAQTNGFSCSDNDLNRIYQAARKTLRLNTLDIFMDCPERERGGWLCDSYFSSTAAWLLWGDLRVEKDFIENFMLTNPDTCWMGFFPEVYPGVHGKPQDVGIPNWSFWLLAELYEYEKRSGDREFVEACRARVTRCVNGMLSLRGESGLIENLESAFVDWSLSNSEAAQKPVSIPVNCLAVHVLEQMAELYHVPAWTNAAAQMREIIEGLDNGKGLFPQNGDSVQLTGSGDHKILRRGNLKTESGAALELFSGFHREDADYIRSFLYTMGTNPEYRSDPNVGKANVFIGMIIRFCVLAELQRTPQLVRELKDLYLAQLRDGSGTLFENYQALSGCHGANGIAAALLTSKVLGIGEVQEKTQSVRIRPNPCGLRWAEGSAKTSGGFIFVHWCADDALHRFQLEIQVPESWSYRLEIPLELAGWEISVNGNLYKT